MKKILILVLIFSTILLCFCGCANENKIAYETALTKASEQDYDEAIKMLESIADEYEEAEELINKIHYARGCELFNQRSYTAA